MAQQRHGAKSEMFHHQQCVMGEDLYICALSIHIVRLPNSIVQKSGATPLFFRLL